MLILYDTSHIKICGLTNYKDLCITKEINKLDTLSFLYPVSDANYDFIIEEGYIRTKENEYVIKEVNYSDDDFDEIVCELNIEGIEGNTVDHFETKGQKCDDCVNLALSGTGWTLGSCDVTKLRDVKKSQCTSYDVLTEIESIYGCEITFDAISKKVYVYQSMGEDKGSYFSEQLNLKKVDTQRNTHSYITRLIPFGKDGLDITTVNNGINYVENHQYSDKVIAAYWSDNRYTEPQDLKDDAIERLDYLSKPQRSYSCDVYDLANISDNYKNILDYNLGDTITLLSRSRGVKEKQRIVNLVQYPDEPEKNTCELSNKLANVEDLITRFVDTSDTVDDVTTSDGMVDGSKLDSIDTDNMNHVHIKIGDIDSLRATISNIGKLSATEGSITLLNAVNGNIQDLLVKKADVDSLSATNIRVSDLETDSETVNNLLAGNLSAKNMQTDFITADCGLIANGAIKDAMIDTLDVKKLLAGDINTNKFKITSDSGNMLMSDNTLQIKDANRTRVQIGKDASNDYNMYVWDANGNLMFDATGLKASGIKNKIIRDDMVSDNANIDGSKIEKESLVSQINGATSTLKASKIKLDTENQTLDAAFTALKTSTDNNTQTVSSQGTAISTIQGQISNKIWSTDITTAVDNIQVGGRNLLLNSATIPTLHAYNASGALSVTDQGNGYYRIPLGSVIEILQDTITSVITGQSYTESFYFKTDSTTLIFNFTFFISGVGHDVVPATIQNLGNGLYRAYATTNVKGNSIRAIDIMNLSYTDGTYIDIGKPKLEKGSKATDYTEAPEDVQGQINSINTNITNNYSTTAQTSNMISTAVSSVSSDLHNNYSTTASMNTAIQQKADSITSSVSANYATQASVNAIKIGGRNLAQGTSNNYSSAYNSFNGGTNVCIANYKVLIDGLQIGDIVTVRLILKYDNIVSASSHASYCCIQGSGNVTGWASGSFNGCSVFYLSDSGEHEFLYNLTITADHLKNSYWDTNIRFDYVQSGSVQWKMFKVEKGTKPTDWTPALEDVQSQIDATNSNFINIVGCSINGSTITKTAATGWGNAGLSSTYKFNNGDYAEFSMQNLYYVMFGLSTADTDQNYSSINYAIYPNDDGTIAIYENGQHKGVFGVWIASDVLGIGVDNSKVNYYKNGKVIYTSTVILTLPLVLDVALYQQNAVISNVKISKILSGMFSRMSSAETLITQLNSSISLKADQTSLNTTNSNVTTAQNAANAAQTAASNAASAASTAQNAANTAQTTANNAQAGVNTANGNISTLTSRMSAAEMKIAPDAIVSTVSSSTVSSNQANTIVDDTDAGITYSGTWNTETNTNLYNSTGKYSNVAGAYFQLTFVGTGIKLHMTKNSQFGIAEVYLDGVDKGTIDFYNPSVIWNYTVDTYSSLPYGKHTIKIAVTGTKNGSSSGFYAELDYMEILNNQVVSASNFGSVLQQNADAFKWSFNNIDSASMQFDTEGLHIKKGDITGPSITLGGSGNNNGIVTVNDDNGNNKIVLDNTGEKIYDSAFKVLSSSGHTALEIDSDGYILNEWGMKCALPSGSTIPAPSTGGSLGSIFADSGCDTLFRAYGLCHGGGEGKYPLYFLSDSEIHCNTLDNDDWQTFKAGLIIGSRLQNRFNDSFDGIGVSIAENDISTHANSGRLWLNYYSGSNVCVGNGHGGYGNLICSTVTCVSGKPALVTTDNYDETYMWSEEAPTPQFTDRGHGIIGSDGKCYVTMDDRFIETVTTNDSDYFIQVTGEKGCSAEIQDKQPGYFIVVGTAGKKFDWQVTADRKGFERLRFNEAFLNI